ncbi:MAG: sigma-70 family RNA polymerase sigma factor [Actinomycetes bacterium]
MHETKFDAQFDQLAAIAHRVAFRITGSREESRDITQETLTRAFVHWRKASKYPEPWVAHVAANLAIDQLRRRSRIPATDPSQIERNEPSTVERLDLVLALNGLPRRQREVIVLRFLADLPEAAVARELHLSIGSVKKHAFRGLAALRHSLSPTTTETFVPILAEDLRTLITSMTLNPSLPMVNSAARF